MTLHTDSLLPLLLVQNQEPTGLLFWTNHTEAYPSGGYDFIPLSLQVEHTAGVRYAEADRFSNLHTGHAQQSPVSSKSVYIKILISLV